MSRNLNDAIQSRLAQPLCRPVYLVCYNFVDYYLKEWTGQGGLYYGGGNYLYPATAFSNVSETYFNLTEVDDRSFRVVNDLGNDGGTTTKFFTIQPSGGVTLGKHRLTFEVFLNGSTTAADISNFMLRLSYRDPQTNLQPVVGFNSFVFDVSDDGAGLTPTVYFAFHQAGDYDVTIRNIQLNVDVSDGGNYYYPDPLLQASFNNDNVNYTRSSSEEFSVVANNASANKYIHLLRGDSAGADKLRTGFHRICFNLTRNSGSLSALAGFYSDVDASQAEPQYGTFEIVEGYNEIDIEIFDDGLDPVSGGNPPIPMILLRVAINSTCDISVTDLKITQLFSPACYTLDFPKVTESVDLSAESVSFTLSGSTELPVNLSDPSVYRNRECEMWIGFLEEDGSLPSTNVYKLFSGTMSEVSFVEDGENDQWKIKAESKLIDLQNQKVARYTHQSQLKLFSGDKGLEFANTAQAGLFLSRNETPDEPYVKKVVYGQAKVEGSVVFMATSGTGSRYLNLVVAFAGHECQAIDQVYLDDRALLSGSSVGGEFTGIVTYQQRLGTSNQSYVSQLASEVGSSVWTSNHKLNGICYCYLRILYSEDLFGTSAPNISALIRGKKLFDPRTNSTSYSDNPALAARDYLLDTTYGFSSGSATVDDATVNTAANDCDLLISKANGTTEKKYTLNGFLSTDATIGENLKLLLDSMAGKVSYLGGEFAIYAGTYALTSAVITEDEMTAPMNLTSKSIRSSYNTAKGVYTSDQLQWKEDEYPAYQSATDLAQDGVSRIIDLPLPFTKSASSAQRIAKINVKRTRFARKLSLQTTLADLNMRAGDVISVSSEKTEIDGGVYEIESMSLDNGLEPYIDVELVETSSSAYDWTTAEETQVGTAPSVANSVLAWSLARLGLPTATPASQNYTIAFSATITHNESGVTCRYTLDGTEPDENDPSISNGGSISISGQTRTLKLKSFQNAGSLTSEVSTYEYVYVAPTNAVPTPTHKWGWTFGSPSVGPSGTSPRLSYAVAMSSTLLQKSSDGGANYSTLASSTTSGSFYNQGNIPASNWSPSNYRAKASRAGYIDSNVFQAPNQCIPPCLWKEVDQYGSYKIGMQAFGTNCSIYWRVATKSKSSNTWGNWSSFNYWTSLGWGDFIGTKYPNKSFETSFTDYEYEVYVAQAGFSNSIIMYANSDTNTLKYGGEFGSFYSFMPSEPDGYSD
jgi:hypothetical protein